MTANLNEDDYRKEQIEFVSNIYGTTARETILLITPSVCSLLLMVTMISLVGKYLNQISRFILEFLVLIVPSVLCLTIYTDLKISFCISLLSLSITNFLIVAFTTNPSTIGSTNSSLSIAKRRPFITNFRALTNMLTAICILAVDFHAFPRRFAKTDLYGFSLMDTGVGFYVVSNALVSRESREFDNDKKTGFLKTVVHNFLSCIRSCIPLLILGSARYFSVEHLNYQKQITEYGIHWNFFVTLAAVKILTSIITSLINPKYSLFIGISVLTTYEYFLNQKLFKKWLFGQSREGFINANREGIVSTLGYVGLYFISVAIGRLIHSTYSRVSKTQSRKSTFCHLTIFGKTVEAQYSDSMVLCVKLSLISAQACAATLFLNAYYGVSRKFANAGYCAWMVTLAAVMMTLLMLIDVVTDILRQLVISRNKNDRKNKLDPNQFSSVPEIFEAINYNGLAFFLVSNLLTGAINMSMRTLYIEDTKAVQILFGYILASTVLFTILYRFRIQIKL